MADFKVEMRQSPRRIGRPGVGRRISMGEKLAADVENAESFISKATKNPITRALPKPARAIGMGSKALRPARMITADLMNTHLIKGGEAARGYLAKKAAQKTVAIGAAKAGAKFIGTKVAPALAVADLAYQTGKVGYGLYQLSKAKKQQREAKAGTQWIKQQMAKRSN